jgi:hypothetical protein
MRYFGLKNTIFLGLIVVVGFPTSTTFALDVTDRFRGELWYLDTISAPQAWETETGSSETIVAILDAGFDLNHEDLVDRYWINENEIEGNNTDNDGNGYEDDVHGWDFVDNDPFPTPETGEGFSDTIVSHGTVIAGIIGATANNGLGITGINWNVSIMPLRVLDGTGKGSTTNVRRAIQYAVENGADVINLSLTFNQTDERLRETIAWAHDQGVVVVASVGNGGVNVDTELVYPACFDVESGSNTVIGVASTSREDTRSDFSNYGSRCVDIAAPGEYIFAAVYQESGSLLHITSYATPWEGTSIATPMVSGAAALLKSAYPSLTPDQIRNALKLSVDPVKESSLDDRISLGAGRLNIARALEYASVFARGSLRSTTTTTASHGSFVVAQARGSSPLVHQVSPSGDVLSGFSAYDNAFTGGVRLAMGDVDGDGDVEIVTGAGPGGGPQVRVFDMHGNVESQFFAYDTGDRNGIFVTTADVNADGIDEIIVTQDNGGTGQVRIFNKQGHLKGSFFPFDRTDRAIRVTGANISDSPGLELVFTHFGSSSTSVVAYDGAGRYIRSFGEIAKGNTSISVTAGDLDQDGFDEIILANGSGYVPEVFIYNHLGQRLRSFFAYPLEFTQGVEVAVGDLDQNGQMEIYVIPQSGGGPHVRVFNSEGSLIGSFFAFPKLNRFGTTIAL